MSSETENEVTSDLMGGIQALKAILNIDSTTTMPSFKTPNETSENEAHYHERETWRVKMNAKEETIQDLQEEISSLKQEASRERSLRKSLESTQESLEAHQQLLTRKQKQPNAHQNPREGESQSRGIEITDRAIGVSTMQRNVAKSAQEVEDRKSLEQKIQELEKSNSKLQKQLESSSTIQKTKSQEQIRIIENLKSSLATKGTACSKLQKQLESSSKNQEIKSQEQRKIIENLKSKLNQVTGELNQATSLSNVAVKSETVAPVAENQVYQVERELERTKELLVAAESKFLFLQTALESTSSQASKQDEKGKEAMLKARVISKVRNLKASHTKVIGKSESLLNELKGTSVSSSAFQQKRNEYKLETIKVGAIYESMARQLKKNVNQSAKKVTSIEAQLAMVREQWRKAKEEEAEAQTEYDECKSGLAQLEPPAAEEPEGNLRSPIVCEEGPQKKKSKTEHQL